MRHLFLSIYGGIVASVLLVTMGMYFAIQHINQARYLSYLDDVSKLTVTLVNNGINRQKPENRERWLNLVASLMDVELRLLDADTGYRKIGVDKQFEQYWISGPRDSAQSYQVLMISSGLTEKWLSATTFLALNEIGHYPIEQRQQVFDSIKQSATFQVERIHSSGIELTSKQKRQLERGDTVLVRSANLGQPEWISAYAPWGNTGDALTIGPIPFFQPYPLHLLLPALAITLVLIALTVWLILNQLRKRLVGIEKTVDAIGPKFYDGEQVTDSGDAIAALNSKIMSMRKRIERLLDEQAYMVRAVSHDLRTPISRLHFRLETIAMLLEEQPNLVEQCRQDLNSLNALIDELLTYERLSSKPDLKLEKVDLKALLISEVDELNQQSTSIISAFETSFAEPFYVQGNTLLLKRLLANLLTNANKYANTKVMVNGRKQDQAWLISIQDDGPGFVPEVIEHVFKPFFKADNARTTSTGQASYGLGLAIARQIAIQHQGDIQASNSTTGGACLTITLPIISAENSSVVSD